MTTTQPKTTKNSFFNRRTRDAASGLGCGSPSRLRTSGPFEDVDASVATRAATYSHEPSKTSHPKRLL